MFSLLKVDLINFRLLNFNYLQFLSRPRDIVHVHGIFAARQAVACYRETTQHAALHKGNDFGAWRLILFSCFLHHFVSAWDYQISEKGIKKLIQNGADAPRLG